MVNDLVFNPNPDIGLLVATYADGDIVLCDPFKDHTLARFRANSHTLAASADGRILAGADGFGTIQVYEFETLRILYRIRSVASNIRQLAFSRDGIRFLDIRGSECNVWEPAVLLRDSGADGSSDTTSVSTSVVETVSIGYSINITAMLVHLEGEFVICGKDDGSIALYETQTGAQVRCLYSPKAQCPIRVLAWWAAKQMLLSIDASNMVVAWKLGKPSLDGWDIEAMLFQSRLDCDSAVTQVLVSQATGKFVLSTRESDHLWNINDQKEEARRSPTRSGVRKWISHPQSPLHMILIQDTITRIFAWSDWSETTTVSLHIIQTGLRVKSAIPCAGRRKILLEFAEQDGHQATLAMQLMDSTVFRLSGAAPANPASAFLSKYSRLVERVAHIIGVYEEKFVFIDVNSWVCSADIDGTEEAKYLRHFFVPYDWFSMTRDIICAIIATGNEKNIVFARHNDVAIVKSGLEYSEEVVMEELVIPCPLIPVGRGNQSVPSTSAALHDQMGRVSLS